MIQGVDTNILVRAFLQDDETQSQQAQVCLKQMADQNCLFISSYALLKFVWVLKVKKFTRRQIYDVIMTLADASETILGQRTLVLKAAEKYLKGQADFGDDMIITEGECQSICHFKTFDQAILKEMPTASHP